MASKSERISFSCHGQHAPAYGCNKPGDNSGDYVEGKAHDAIVKCLVEALQNMLSAFDNPIARRRLADSFSREAIDEARRVVSEHQSAQAPEGREANTALATHQKRRADDADHSAQTLDMVQTDLIKRLRIKAGMIQMGERIEWGSDSGLMYEAADVIEQLMARDEQYTPADMADQGAQGWRDGYAWAKGEGCPEGYVMVPVEPTAEMLVAINWPNDPAGYRAMLAAAPQAPAAPAAPAVQGEPVDLRQRLFNGWKGCSNHGCVVVDPKPGVMRTNGSCQCVVNASRSQLYMLQGRIQSVLSATPQPAEQSAPGEVERPVAFVKYDSPIKGHTEFMRYEPWMDDGLSTGWIPLYSSQLAAHQKQEEGK